MGTPMDIVNYLSLQNQKEQQPIEIGNYKKCELDKKNTSSKTSVKLGNDVFPLESIEVYRLIGKEVYFTKVYERIDKLESFLGMHYNVWDYKWNGIKAIISQQKYDNCCYCLKHNSKVYRYIKLPKTGKIQQSEDIKISSLEMKFDDIWQEERMCLRIQAYGKTYDFIDEMLDTTVQDKYAEIKNLFYELKQENKRKEKEAQQVLNNNLRKEQFVNKFKIAVNKILAEIEQNFSNADVILEKYKNVKKVELVAIVDQYYDKKVALNKMMEFINHEYSQWLDGQWSLVKEHDPSIQDEDYVQYRELAKQYLLKKYNIFYDVADDALSDLIISIYDQKENSKEWLRGIIDDLTFTECLDLLRKFRNTFHELNILHQSEGREIGEKSRDAIKKCLEYYDNAHILTQKKLNNLSHNKEKNVYIEENKYNEALLYFYEGKTLEEINDIIKQNTYIKNKSMGNRGEEAVDYALSWLPKEYVRIPQMSVGKYEQKCILIKNTSFRNEKQEFDHIIVGPQGIFLVETKNFAGEIIIDEEGNWVRRKEGQGVVGERNPIEQIRRHEKLIQSIVPGVNIISIMCLSHPKVVVKGASNSPVKILKSDLLCDYIESYKADSLLGEDEIQAVVDKIKSYMV